MAAKQHIPNPTAVASSDREKALDAALAQIERQFGKGSVMRLGEEGRAPVAVIPTGSIALDVALGIDEGGKTSGGLDASDRVQCHRGFARGFRAIDLDDASAGQTTDAQCHIQGNRPRRDHLDGSATFLAQAHDRALAKVALDLGQCGLEGLFPVISCSCHGLSLRGDRFLIDRDGMRTL